MSTTCSPTVTTRRCFVNTLPAGEQREGRSDSIVTVAATRRALSSERWDLAAMWLGESDTFELRWGMCRTRINMSSSMAANTRDFPGTSPPLSPPSPKTRGFSFSSISSSSEKRKKIVKINKYESHAKDYMKHWKLKIKRKNSLHSKILQIWLMSN